MSWQVKKDGVVKAKGPGDVLDAYSAETLKQKKAAGHKIYQDGKVWKK